MLGLKRKIVKLVVHSTAWAATFQKVKAALIDCLQDQQVEIEHIGSTAIDNLPAKPILDIGIGVKSLKEIPKIVAILSKNGYVDRGNRPNQGGHLLVKYKVPEIAIQHIHILATHDTQWGNYLFFRDCLRGDKALKNKYENLKKTLAKRYEDDRGKYTNGKAVFIKSVLAQKGNKEK